MHLSVASADTTAVGNMEQREFRPADPKDVPEPQQESMPTSRRCAQVSCASGHGISCARSHAIKMVVESRSRSLRPGFFTWEMD